MARKSLVRVLIVLSLVAYSLVVYGWWIEGNNRQSAPEQDWVTYQK